MPEFDNVTHFYALQGHMSNFTVQSIKKFDVPSPTVSYDCVIMAAISVMFYISIIKMNS
jgi:hypothetical protein